MKNEFARGSRGLLLVLCWGCGSAPEGDLFAERPTAADTDRLRQSPAEESGHANGITSGGSQPSAPARGASDPTGSHEDVPQAAPAQVLWTAPAHGDAGVAGDREVVLQFSEAMNIASVEAALATNFPGRVVLSWEGGGTLLRLRSSTPLAYAEGATSEAIEYQVGISSAALSLAGRPLAPLALSFRTLRRVRSRLTPVLDPELTGVGSSVPLEQLAEAEPSAEPQDLGAPHAEADVDPEPEEADPGGADTEEVEPEPDLAGFVAEPCFRSAAVCAGDLPGGAGWIQVKGFLTFDLEPLPPGAQLEGARLQLSLEGTVGDPFGTEGLGRLHAERTWFSRIDPPTFRADPDATLGVLSEGASEVLSGDISWVIQEARERGLTQFRLTFPQATNRDARVDLAVFLLERQVLELTYLVP